MFPAKPNPRLKGGFKKPHAWDFGKRFRRVVKLAGIHPLRIHDLRHFAASTLTSAGIEDNIIGLLTGVAAVTSISEKISSVRQWI